MRRWKLSLRQMSKKKKKKTFIFLSKVHLHLTACVGVLNGISLYVQSVICKPL